MLIYFCGNLTNGKIVPSFTEVLPTSSELQLTTMINIQKNFIAIDSNLSVYKFINTS